MSNRIWDEKEHFIQEHYVCETDIHRKIRERAKEKHCEHMMIAPSEARVLQSLVEVHGSHKVIEIGTLFGYSAIYLASGLPSDGKVWTLEKNPENAEIAQGFIKEAGLSEKIEVVVGDAHENLKSLEKFGPFDAAFIDADKPGYPAYLKWCEKNLRKNALIIADNTFLGGDVWAKASDGESKNRVTAMLEFHKNFSDKKRFRSTIYPSFDGYAVGIKLN